MALHTLEDWSRIVHKTLSIGVLGVVGLFPMAVGATSLRPANVVDLISHAELVHVAQVLAVSDGIDDRGYPFTEVVLDVTDALKGGSPGTFTFRQFGLLGPREVGNGLTNVAVSPDGWPTFRPGEEVIVFLNPPARRTGFRATVGLFQGKFTRTEAGWMDGNRNLGVFRQVEVENGLLTPPESELLERTGAIDPDAFLSFLHRAIDGRWIEEGRLRHASR